MGEVEAEVVKQPKLEMDDERAGVGGKAVVATLYACQLNPVNNSEQKCSKRSTL